MAIRLRFLEPLLALVLTATLFGSCVAHAQTVQPTYIRPSKGASIAAISAKTVGIGVAASCTIATPCFSPVFDMTAFDAVQLFIRDSSTQAVISGPWIVPNLTPFIKLRMVTQLPGFSYGLFVNVLGAATASTAAAFTQLPASGANYAWDAAAGVSVDLVMVPIPISSKVAAVGPLNEGDLVLGTMAPPVIVGGLKPSGIPGIPSSVQSIRIDSSTGGVVVKTSGTVTVDGSVAIKSSITGIANSRWDVSGPTNVHAADATHCSVSVMNVSTTIAYCTQTGGFGFWPLAAAAAADSPGGTVTYPNYGGDVYCSTRAGTARVAVQATSCPP